LVLRRPKRTQLTPRSYLKLRTEAGKRKSALDSALVEQRDQDIQVAMSQDTGSGVATLFSFTPLFWSRYSFNIAHRLSSGKRSKQLSNGAKASIDAHFGKSVASLSNFKRNIRLFPGNVSQRLTLLFVAGWVCRGSSLPAPLGVSQAIALVSLSP
jgi:hypothetical protein